MAAARRNAWRFVVPRGRGCYNSPRMASRTVQLQPPEQQPAPVAAPAPRRSFMPALLLTLILVVAAGLRFNGLNWDDGKLLHPDERFITDVIANRIHAPSLKLLLDPAHSPLNPRSVDPNPTNPGQQGRKRQFAYGSLPLFVTDLAAALWGAIRRENWNEFYRIFRVGRVLTVLMDLATIALIYALARRAHGTATALLASAFMALAVMPIQLAHFFVTDTWVTTFVTAALLATLVAAERGTARAFALAGLLVGCAMATKGPAAHGGHPAALLGAPLSRPASLVRGQVHALHPTDRPAAADLRRGAPRRPRRLGASARRAFRRRARGGRLLASFARRRRCNMAE